MKNFIKILFIFLVLGCSSENEPSNAFSITNISPQTARVGDIITVTGNNVDRLSTMYFKNNQNESQNYTLNGGQIYLPESTEQKSFYIIPDVRSEKVIIGKGNLQGGQGDKDNFEFNFNTVGFFQIKTGMPFDDLPFFSQYQLQTVNDNLAFALVDGQMYKSTNGYYKWEHISTINLNNITNYYFLDENNGWLFTYGNQKINMYYTQDGGKNLALKFSADYNIFLDNSVYKVKFINPNFGLFSIGGKVFFTDNNTYKDIYDQYPDLNNLPFGNVDFFDFTIRSENLIYLNSSGSTNLLVKVENSTASYNDDFDSVPIGSTQFFGGTAYQQVNNSIFKSIDNGASWNKIKTFDDFFPSIHFIDSQIGLVFSDYETQVVYKTIDGGATWFEYFFPKEFEHKSILIPSDKDYKWLFNIGGKLYKYIEE